MLLSEQHLDIFKELINIGIGKSASLLSDLTSSHINLSIPQIWVDRFSKLKSFFADKQETDFFAIKLGFDGVFSGVAELVFPTQSALKLVVLITGDDDNNDELDVIKTGTLNEVANLLLNGVMGTISNLLNEEFQYSLPVADEDYFNNLSSDEIDEKIVLLGETHFEVADKQIEGDIILLLELSAFENLKTALDKLVN